MSGHHHHHHHHYTNPQNHGVPLRRGRSPPPPHPPQQQQLQLQQPQPVAVDDFSAFDSFFMNEQQLQYHHLQQQQQQHFVPTPTAPPPPPPTPPSVIARQQNFKSQQPQQQQQQQQQSNSMMVPVQYRVFVLPPPPTQQQQQQQQVPAENFNNNNLYAKQQQHQRIGNNNFRVMMPGSKQNNNMGVAKQQQQRLVGLSTELERDYTRDEPRPEQIRPLRVLRLAFEHVKRKSVSVPQHFKSRVEGMSWLFMQLKAMRQDIRCQDLRNSFAATVYEALGVLALQMGDFSEYLAVQSAVRLLHVEYGVAGTSGLAVEEFAAYRLLQVAMTQNSDMLANEVHNMSVESERCHVIAAMLDTLLRSGDVEFQKQIVRPVTEKVLAAGGRVPASASASAAAAGHQHNSNSAAPSLEQLVLCKDSWSKVAAQMKRYNASPAGQRCPLGFDVLDRSSEIVLNNVEIDRILATNETATMPARNSLLTEQEKSEINSNNTNNQQLTYTSAFPANVSLMRRPAIVALLDAIALLERGDGGAFCSAMVELTRKFPHLRSGVLCQLQFGFLRLRTRWAVPLLRGLKGSKMVPVRLIAGALGFLSGIDRAMHREVHGAIGKIWNSMQMRKSNGESDEDDVEDERLLSASFAEDDDDDDDEYAPDSGNNNNNNNGGNGNGSSSSSSEAAAASAAALGEDKFAQRSWKAFFQEIKLAPCPLLPIYEKSNKTAPSSRPILATMELPPLLAAVEEYLRYLNRGSLRTPTAAVAPGA